MLGEGYRQSYASLLASLSRLHEYTTTPGSSTLQRCIDIFIMRATCYPSHLRSQGLLGSFSDYAVAGTDPTALVPAIGATSLWDSFCRALTCDAVYWLRWRPSQADG